MYLLWYAAIVVALEVGCGGARWTVFGQLIGIVSAVVFSIAEQPSWNAPVVRLARTPLPAICTVSLSAHVGWFVTVVSTILENAQFNHTQISKLLPVLTLSKSHIHNLGIQRPFLHENSVSASHSRLSRLELKTV